MRNLKSVLQGLNERILRKKSVYRSVKGFKDRLLKTYLKIYQDVRQVQHLVPKTCSIQRQLPRQSYKYDPWAKVNSAI